MSNLSVAAYRHYSGAATSAADPVIQKEIDAAERIINGLCAREFVKAHASTTSARLFVPDGTDVLRIDDCVEITAVTENGVAVDASAFQKEPVNGRSQSGLAVPFDQLRRLSGRWACDGGRATVSVTARWGWPAIPDDYLEAVRVLTKELLDDRSIVGGVVGLGPDGVVRARRNTKVMAALTDLIRVEAWGIA